MHLNQDQKQTLVHALRVAAERFGEDAKTCAFNPRLAEQFVRQAAESRDLADTLDDANDGVEVRS
jgi:hypothetical protein